MRDALTERVARLEQLNRRLLGGLALATLGAAVLLSLGFMPGKEKLIEAERLILRDANGHRRVECHAGPKGPALTFFDADGTQRLRLQTEDDGASTLSLHQPSEQARRDVTLKVAPDGWSLLSFADAKQQERLAVGLGYDGEPRLRMYTRDGKARASLGSDMSGRVDCVLHDANGTERAVIRSAPGGTPSITLYDSQGKAVYAAP